MNTTNLNRAERWRIQDHDPADPPAIGGPAAARPGRPSNAHRDRAAWIVLIIGLFGLAWMVLMRDVRVGLPAQVTSTPREAARAAEGTNSAIPEARTSPRAAGADGT